MGFACVYSPIEHLARIVDGGKWREVLLSMLTGAFDAGGSEYDQPILVVAGFVSSANDWGEFSGLWNKRLADDGLTHFHAVDFAHSREEFDGWRGHEARRKKLLGDLMKLIQRHAYRKFGSIVVNKAFRETLSDEMKQKFASNAFVLGAWGCAAAISMWAKRDQIKTPFKHVFEEGDIGRGKLVQLLLRDGYAAPDFAPKVDRVDPNGNVIKAFVPLQAADWLAYEVLQDFKARETTRNFRWAGAEFLRMHGDVNIFEAENLSQLIEIVEQVTPTSSIIQVRFALPDWGKM